MKTKVLSFLVAGGLLSVAAWLVHRNGTLDSRSQNTLVPVTHGAEPDAGQTDAVPEKYRETVRKGLEYLVKHQAKDGHWEGDDGKHPVAMTGLVGVALLMERDNPRFSRFGRNEVIKAKYSDQIRNAVDWLIARSQAGRDGLIFADHPSETARYMEGHGLATLFLAGACGRETDDKRRKDLTAVLTRAVKYIAKAQSAQGGWYHTSKVEGHDFAAISATVIQIQALQAAENVGIPIPGEAVGAGQEYLKSALAKYEGAANPEQQRSRLADTAAVLACRGGIFRRGDKDKLTEKWFAYCRTELGIANQIKFGSDDLAQYYYAQAMYLLGDEDRPFWTNYCLPIFDHLQSTQNKDGSWPAGDGLSVGPLYATALRCIILQLDHNSHPSTRLVSEIVK